MNCFFFHKWNKWSEPFDVAMVYLVQGERMNGMEHHQRRTCLKCGEIEERVL